MLVLDEWCSTAGHTREEEDQCSPEKLALDGSRGLEELKEDVDVDEQDKESKDTAAGSVSDDIAVPSRLDRGSGDCGDHRAEEDELIH